MVVVGGTIWLVSREGDRRDHRAAVSPNQLHLRAMTDSHARLRRSQSAFRVLPADHRKSIILESLTFYIFGIKSMTVTVASTNVWRIRVISIPKRICNCEINK